MSRNGKLFLVIRTVNNRKFFEFYNMLDTARELGHLITKGESYLDYAFPRDSRENRSAGFWSWDHIVLQDITMSKEVYIREGACRS